MPYISIPPPHEPFIDKETGKVTDVWYRYLSGGNISLNSVSTAVTAAIGGLGSMLGTMAISVTTGSTATVVPGSSVKYVFAIGTGPGGGGAGVKMGTTGSLCGGGGGGGATAIALWTTADWGADGIAITIGTSGVAGTTAGTAGTTGSDTTIVTTTTTLTCGSGEGGTTTGAAGTGGTAAGGDLNTRGAGGLAGFGYNGGAFGGTDLQYGGGGGGSFWGGGAASVSRDSTGQTAGVAGLAHGAGGGGAVAYNTTNGAAGGGGAKGAAMLLLFSRPST